MPPRSGTSSASMHTNPSSFTSSWLGGSPNRKSPSRNSPVRNGLRTPARDSPLRTATSPLESPSQRLILEFSQMLIRSDEKFAAELDEQSAENAKRYQAQLTKAAVEHEKVRTEAELERRRIIEEEESAQRKREADLRRELEAQAVKKAREEAEEQQRQAEAKRHQEEAAREAAEKQRKIQEEDARRKAQKDQEEAARQQQLQKDEEARKAKEVADAAQAAAKAQAEALKQAPPAAQATVPPPAPAAAAPATASATTTQVASSSATIEEIHSRYLELHKRMKAFWKPFKSTCSQKGHPLKETVGELRRGLRRTVGQVSITREDSKVVIAKLREMLKQCRDAGGPTVDIRPFIISREIPALSDEAQAQYPALLLYAFICVEKAALQQFGTEAATGDGRIIGELGTIVASLFVDTDYCWNGIPLVDILLAKWHKVCPILFGIRGHMKSTEGMLRLGALASGQHIPQNDYNERMEGLACGYAAMSLRLVERPAIPMSEYWRAVTQICNTPSENLYSGHFYVLRGLVRHTAAKFMQFYGVQGRAVLRYAVTVLPERSPDRAKDAASIVAVLPDTWRAAKIII